MGIHNTCDVKDFHPIGQKIDALLIAEGFTRKEIEGTDQSGFSKDTSFRRVTYNRAEENVFLMMNWPAGQKETIHA